MSLHRSSTGQDNIHVVHAFEFANSTDREAGTGYSFTAADVKKVALQLDDYSYWVLTDDSPLTWVAIGATSADSTPADGWIESADTWTYASADDPTFTFTIAGVDRSAILTPGTRIKLTQTTAKYFIVTKVAFSTDTTVTIYGGTDYDLANAAITLPFYSRVKAPAGFPMSPIKWTHTLSDTTQRTQLTPANGTYYNLGSLSIDIPIGVWRVKWQLVAEIGDSSVSSLNYRVTLSTANNSQSDVEFTCFYQMLMGSDSVTIYQQESKEKWLDLAAKTTYYLNMATFIASAETIDFRGDVVPTKVECICGYL